MLINTTVLMKEILCLKRLVHTLESTQTTHLYKCITQTIHLYKCIMTRRVNYPCKNTLKCENLRVQKIDKYLKLHQ